MKTIAELIEAAKAAQGAEVHFVGRFSRGPYYAYIAALDPTTFLEFAEAYQRMHASLVSAKEHGDKRRREWAADALRSCPGPAMPHPGGE